MAEVINYFTTKNNVCSVITTAIVIAVIEAHNIYAIDLLISIEFK